MWRKTLYFSLSTNVTEMLAVLEDVHFSKYFCKCYNVSGFPHQHVIFKNLSWKPQFTTSSGFNWKVCSCLICTTPCVYGVCFVWLSRLQHIFTQCQLSVDRKQQVVHSLKASLQIFLLYVSLFFRLNFRFNRDMELFLFIVIFVIGGVWRNGFSFLKNKL